MTNIPRYVSQRNGGYALYSSFEFIESAVKFKLLLYFRLADHPTKHLEEKLEDRKNILKQTYSKIEKGQAECYVIDSYIEQHGGDICIYFGGPSAYSNKPYKSIEQANEILVSKLRIASQPPTTLKGRGLRM